MESFSLASIRFSAPKYTYYPRGIRSHTIEMFLGDKIVGEINFTKHSDQMWMVNQMDIYDQGKGFGRLLVNHFEMLAKSSGVKDILLSSIEESVGFWEKMGYHRDGDGTAMYKNLDEVGVVRRR